MTTSTLPTQSVQQLLTPLLEDWTSFCLGTSASSAPAASPEELSALKKLLPESSSILLFAISPVQEFIESSMSLRDLWASSLILSQLVEAVLQKVTELGGFVVYPRKPASVEAGEIEASQGNQSAGQVALTPHRFLAVVPNLGVDGIVIDSESACVKAFKAEWKKFADEVRDLIDDEITKICDQDVPTEKETFQKQLEEFRAASEGWDKRWKDQVNCFWEVRTVSVPLHWDALTDDFIARAMGGMFFSDRFPELSILRNAAAKSNIQNWNQVGRWQILTQLVNRMLTAKYPVRYAERKLPLVMPTLDQPTAEKCRMFGSFEMIGPDSHAAQQAFWSMLRRRSELHLKDGERYSAIGMIKRLLPYCMKWTLPSFDDSARVAAVLWLKKETTVGKTIESRLDEKTKEAGEGGWESRWMHQESFDEQDSSKTTVSADNERNRFKAFRAEFASIKAETKSSPPIYYAALLMDADNCHQRLAGKTLPVLRSEKALRDFDPDSLKDSPWLKESWETILSCRHPLTPKYHTEISEKQSRFGTDVVNPTLADHSGQVIYIGGDEFLAFLPVSEVFDAALKIRQRFSANEFFGAQGTMSAGIVVAHYKADLRAVLQEVRSMMALAKSRGRNFCQISLQTHTGETTVSACPWSMMSMFNGLRAAFTADTDSNGKPSAKASDRWLRKMLEDWATLEVFEADDVDLHPAILMFLQKYVAHSDKQTQSRLVEVFKAFPQLMPHIGSGDHRSGNDSATIIANFCELYVRETAPRFRGETYALGLRAARQFLDLCEIASSCSGKGKS